MKIELHVTEVHQERMDITTLEGPPRTTGGRTFVVFREEVHGELVQVEWTWRGDLPEVGSYWVLTDEEGA